MIEALKMAYKALIGLSIKHGEMTDEGMDAIAAIEKALAQEKALQALHHENERLGLYKDAYAEQKPQIKTTDPFESSRVGDYNRGWNDCLFASGIVKQPEQEPVVVCCQQYDTCLKPCTPRGRHLAQRTWVGLTDEEMMDAIYVDDTPMERGRRVEAKIKERNT